MWEVGAKYTFLSPFHLEFIRLNGTPKVEMALSSINVNQSGWVLSQANIPKETHKLVFPLRKVIFGVNRHTNEAATSQSICWSFYLGFYSHSYEFGASAFLSNLIPYCLLCELYISPTIAISVAGTPISVSLHLLFLLPGVIVGQVLAELPLSHYPGLSALEPIAQRDFCWWPKVVSLSLIIITLYSIAMFYFVYSTHHYIKLLFLFPYLLSA